MFFFMLGLFFLIRPFPSLFPFLHSLFSCFLLPNIKVSSVDNPKSYTCVTSLCFLLLQYFQDHNPFNHGSYMDRTVICLYKFCCFSQTTKRKDKSHTHKRYNLFLLVSSLYESHILDHTISVLCLYFNSKTLRSISTYFFRPSVLITHYTVLVLNVYRTVRPLVVLC